MVFGLFSKEKSLQKTIEKATNKLAQQPDRWGALERLKEEGTDEAIFGLCKRFGITSMKGVEDEQEKNWVVDTLVQVGATALPSLVRYMKSAEQLSFPLRVLERVADRAKVLEVADALFASEPPGYVRMPERRIDLLRWFSEWKPGTDDEVIARLTPYISDFDENSRFAAIDGMAGRDPAKIAPPLIAALTRPEEESGRIKRTIVEVLEKSKAPLGDQAKAVATALAGPLSDDFKVDGNHVKKR
ncbi:MAG: hypothetical protein H6Q90_1562 [Deltaproteobacteria bacterium]|nr:hypothetical protein [Deltaproteobacteria bacterium]